MTITDKADLTFESIRSFFDTHKYLSPVLNCSFGKDSTVLLHLLNSNGIHLPVIYYRDPWFPRKNAFADFVTTALNLEVHNYPPLRVSLKTSPQMVALVSEYSTGPHSLEAMLKNTIEIDDDDDPDDFLCGIGFLSRPCSTFAYPWDLALIGHKDSDTDQIYGPIPLHSELVMRDSGPDFYFPLKSWTDADVWDYIDAFDIPYQEDRYDKANRREWEDKSANSDWYPVCLRCVDKRKAGRIVFCPKVKQSLTNVSHLVPEFGWI